MNPALILTPTAPSTASLRSPPAPGGSAPGLQVRWSLLRLGPQDHPMPPRIGVTHDAFAFHAVNHPTRPIKTDPEASLQKRNRRLSRPADNPCCLAIQGFVIILGHVDVWSSPT